VTDRCSSGVRLGLSSWFEPLEDGQNEGLEPFHHFVRRSQEHVSDPAHLLPTSVSSGPCGESRANGIEEETGVDEGPTASAECRATGKLPEFAE
jgi:hypothetical protein